MKPPSNHYTTYNKTFVNNYYLFCNLVEMEALKYAPSWGLRHRRDSVSGLSVHSQPYGFGGNSPAPTYHSQGK